mmetsp:Transcript_94704/g.254800  ORF Transcript_94704/g.254800 Transcript_94704/m.254800 type:complete len:146 (+) Transcript_94704:48-485(+)
MEYLEHSHTQERSWAALPRVMSARAAIATAPWKSAPWKLAVVDVKKKHKKFKQQAKEQQHVNSEKEQHKKFRQQAKAEQHECKEQHENFEKVEAVVRQRPQPSSAPCRPLESVEGSHATVPLAIPELLRAVAQLMDSSIKPLLRG